MTIEPRVIRPKDHKQVFVRRAHPFSGTQNIPTVCIRITEEFPYFHNDTKQKAAEHRKDAEAIEEALNAALPGGTYDCLLVAMLLRSATYHSLSYGDLEIPNRIYKID